MRDEIAESLRYYDTSLFAVIPGLQHEVVADVRRTWDLPAHQPIDLGPVVSMGSWIGGVGDDNPFVTADAFRIATGLQAEVALGHHLDGLGLAADGVVVTG